MTSEIPSGQEITPTELERWCDGLLKDDAAVQRIRDDLRNNPGGVVMQFLKDQEDSTKRGLTDLDWKHIANANGRENKSNG